MAQFAARMATLGAAGIRRALVPAFAEAASDAGGAGGGIRSRTGRLLGSVRIAVSADGTSLTVRAGGPSAPYAAVIERGGTLHATRGRYLRVPLPPALSGGIDAYSGVSVGSARFRVARAGDGRLFLVDPRTGEAWYRLVERVTIRGRPYLRPAFDFAARRFPEHVLAAVVRATGGA